MSAVPEANIYGAKMMNEAGFNSYLSTHSVILLAAAAAAVAPEVPSVHTY